MSTSHRTQSAVLDDLAGQAPDLLASLHNRLVAAVAKVDRLKARKTALSYDAEAGIEGASDTLAEVTKDLATAERHVDQLQEAIGVAEQRQREAEQRKQAALWASQIEVVRQHLRLRDEAAEAFATAQATAITAWRELVKNSEAARRACPIDSPWPNGGLSSVGEIQSITKEELYRVGASLDDVSQNRFGFPGGEVYDFALQGRPGAIEPMTTRLRDASAHVLRALDGKGAP